ncbi:MAG: GNAT family N-acetyltransferase [Defluviitaleaceae bacterium]|nr:GNAT family N-acetyltransferase [Defluviitaleaceae bacterium]
MTLLAEQQNRWRTYCQASMVRAKIYVLEGTMLKVSLVEASKIYEKQVMDYRQEFIECGEREINGSSGLLEYDNYDKWLRDVMVEKDIKCSLTDTSAAVYFLLREDDGRIIGSTKLRHHLTEELLKDGGNIGYGVRPSERWKGYGTVILSLVLEEAKKLGLNKVMISCNKDNRASAHVAIRNGGILAREGFDEDEGKITEIYWIDIV